MKLGPNGSQAGKWVSPFSLMMERGQNVNSTVSTGAGVGVDREVPGLGKPRSAKRVRPFAQTLGDTPPRDGPFAPGAAVVAVATPPKARQRVRIKQPKAANPFAAKS